MLSPADADREQLIHLAQGGAAEALGQLLELYRNYLTLLARVQIGQRLQGKVDAADVVQDTFLEAHRHFARFRGSTEPELAAWLRQILATTLSHLVRRYYGTGQRDVRLERNLGDALDQSSRAWGEQLVGQQTSPSQRASRREQAVLLADALQQLPESYREVIVLHHFEGLTFPQVAARMGRTEDSVEKLWVRGLARLRGTLGEPS